MKSHSSITLSALSFVSLSLAVSPPPQFNGNQNGIGSWFQTNTADSHTNGHSWCGYPYSDDQPLFAPVSSAPASRKTKRKAIFLLLTSRQSLALMGGATSGPSWDAQRRQYCGREAKVTNTATGVSKLLYIGDSFAQPRSGGAIDIVIGAFIDLYGKDPKGNHNLVMNNVEWHLTGNVDPKYTVPGNNFGDSGPTTLQTSTTKGGAPVSTPAG
ncbi:MAG: hypothetical protein Q9228_006810, partial [Teloschistes exilis]